MRSLSSLCRTLRRIPTNLLHTENNAEVLAVLEKVYEYALQDDASKRRRLAVEPADDGKLDPNTVVFELADLSFVSPLRKKLNLVVSINRSTQKPMISLFKQGSDHSEWTLNDTSSANIRFATLLPSREKHQNQYLVIFYREGSSSKDSDPMVCTFTTSSLVQQLQQSGKLKNGQELQELLSRQFLLTGFKLQHAFTHKSFHVQAHRGTKEGVLYFLANHILFGFKKPILLFESHEIGSIQYSNITRITFSVTLILTTGERVEFSMIDQEEFGAIDSYVKGRQVTDMSMSDELKAKPLKGASQGGELDRAEEEAVDVGHEEEDEEEEDDDYTGGNAEIDDTSDVSGDEEDEEDEDEEDDEEDREIELNSDDD